MRFLTIQLTLALVLIAQPAQGEPIRIGANLSLSGKTSYVGQTQLKGLTLAAEELREDPSNPHFEIVAEDNAGEPKQAVSAMQKLLDLDRADLVFTSLTHIVQAVKDTVRQRGKVMLYAAGTDGPAREYERFFRDWSDAGRQGQVLAEAALRLGKRRVAIIGEQSDAVFQLRDTFVEAIAKTSAPGAAITGQEYYPPGESDFRTLLLKLGSAKPDALAIFTWRDNALVLSQLKALGLNGIQSFHIFAPMIPANDTPAARSLFEDNRAVSLWHGVPPGSTGGSEKPFMARFRARFGEEPRTEAVFAYDDVMMLAEAVRACGTAPLDQKCIAKKLTTLKHQGINEEVSFGPERLGKRRELLIEVSGGQWRCIP